MQQQRTLRIKEQKVNGKPRVLLQDERGKTVKTFKNVAEAWNFVASASRVGKFLK